MLDIAIRRGSRRRPRPPRRPARTTTYRPRSTRRGARASSVNFSPAPENTLMPLSSNGLCDAEITTPAVKSELAGQIRHAGRRNDAGARDVRAARPRAMRQLALDPRAGFARVAADQEARRWPVAGAPARAPRRAGARSADREDTRPPCRGRRLCRRVEVSSSAIGMVTRTLAGCAASADVIGRGSNANRQRVLSAASGPSMSTKAGIDCADSCRTGCRGPLTVTANLAARRARAGRGPWSRERVTGTSAHRAARPAPAGSRRSRMRVSWKAQPRASIGQPDRDVVA